MFFVSLLVGIFLIMNAGGGKPFRVEFTFKRGSRDLFGFCFVREYRKCRAEGMEAFLYLFPGSLPNLKSSCDFMENLIIPDHIVDWGIAISGFGFFRPLYSNTFESQPKNVVRKYFEFQPK